MRKIILTGLLIFTIVLGFITYKAGLTFPTKVYSKAELEAKKEETDMQLSALTTLKSGTFKTVQQSLAQSVQTFENTKVLYQQAENSMTETDKRKAIAGTRYNLDYIWVKLGNYATQYNCDLTMEVYQNQEVDESENYILCDFKFNIVGSYAKTISFIEAISTDSDLNFIPENMKMYSEYRNLDTFTYYDGTYLGFDEDGKPLETNATILALVTDFYKTSVPIIKTSLSKVENEQTLQAEAEAEAEAAKNGNTTNTTK